MTFFTVTTKQLIFNSIFIAILAAAMVEGISFAKEYYKLPQVFMSKDSTCVKVVNFENGHAFNCNDVDVILRRYRQVIE